MKLTYSLFEGYSLSKVRRVVELEGKKARDMLAIFKRGLGREPRVGDVYAGGRIDAIEDDATRQLAVRFRDELWSYLSPDLWESMLRRNATPEYDAACASHDFLDANMVMANAWKATFGEEPSFPLSDDETARWNAAWAIAKREFLTAKESDQ